MVFNFFELFIMVFPKQKPSKSDVFPMEHQAFSVALPGRQPCGEAELSLRRDAAAVSGPTPRWVTGDQNPTRMVPYLVVHPT